MKRSDGEAVLPRKRKVRNSFHQNCLQAAAHLDQSGIRVPPHPAIADHVSLGMPQALGSRMSWNGS